MTKGYLSKRIHKTDKISFHTVSRSESKPKINKSDCVYLQNSGDLTHKCVVHGEIHSCVDGTCISFYSGTPVCRVTRQEVEMISDTIISDWYTRLVVPHSCLKTDSHLKTGSCDGKYGKCKFIPTPKTNFGTYVCTSHKRIHRCGKTCQLISPYSGFTFCSVTGYENTLNALVYSPVQPLAGKCFIQRSTHFQSVCGKSDCHMRKIVRQTAKLKNLGRDIQLALTCVLYELRIIFCKCPVLPIHNMQRVITLIAIDVMKIYNFCKDSILLIDSSPKVISASILYFMSIRVKSFCRSKELKSGALLRYCDHYGACVQQYIYKLNRPRTKTSAVCDIKEAYNYFVGNKKILALLKSPIRPAKVTRVTAKICQIMSGYKS